MLIEDILEEIKKEKDWYRKAVLISAFHTSKLYIINDKRPNGWTIYKTAEITGLSVGYVSESIKIASNLDSSEGMTREAALKFLNNGKK